MLNYITANIISEDALKWQNLLYLTQSSVLGRFDRANYMFHENEGSI